MGGKNKVSPEALSGYFAKEGSTQNGSQFHSVEPSYREITVPMPTVRADCIYNTEKGKAILLHDRHSELLLGDSSLTRR